MKAIRRVTGMRDLRGLSAIEKAQELARYLTAAAHAGYIEEALVNARAMLPNVRVYEDMDLITFAGYRLEWSRSKKRYGVFEQIASQKISRAHRTDLAA